MEPFIIVAVTVIIAGCCWWISGSYMEAARASQEAARAYQENTIAVQKAEKQNDELMKLYTRGIEISEDQIPLQIESNELFRELIAALRNKA